MLTPASLRHLWAYAGAVQADSSSSVLDAGLIAAPPILSRVISPTSILRRSRCRPHCGSATPSRTRPLTVDPPACQTSALLRHHLQPAHQKQLGASSGVLKRRLHRGSNHLGTGEASATQSSGVPNAGLIAAGSTSSPPITTLRSSGVLNAGLIAAGCTGASSGSTGCPPVSWTPASLRPGIHRADRGSAVRPPAS